MDKNFELPPADYLRARLDYDPDKGVLTWRFNPNGPNSWNAKWAGKEAFTAGFKGYKTGRLDGKQHLAHRLIWAWATGVWPDKQIDHINGNRADNRLSNLRCVDNQTNSRNASLSRNNTSGVTGVWFEKRRNHWCAEIKVNRRKIYLGSYADFKSAMEARKQAEISYGFHSNHGMPLKAKRKKK